LLKINKQDFLNIKTLLENETITEKKFKNQKIVNKLKLNGAVIDGKKTAKVRWINLNNTENIFNFLRDNSCNIDSLDDINSYIDEIFDNKPTRDTIQKWHKDTKRKNSKSLKGLYISSLNSLVIKLDSEAITILPNNGLGYFLFHTQKVELNKDTIVVGVENYQVVWFAKKYKKSFESKDFLFVVVNPYMLEWIESLKNEYIHFGDYDLAGINIYQNKIIPRLKNSKKHSMFIPQDIEYLIKEYGCSELYEKQKSLQDITVNDDNVRALQTIINTFAKNNP